MRKISLPPKGPKHLKITENNNHICPKLFNRQLPEVILLNCIKEDLCWMFGQILSAIGSSMHGTNFQITLLIHLPLTA